MENHTQNEQRSFTEKQASFYVSLSASTLRQARCHGKREGITPVPKHIKIGRAVRYLREDLDAFLDKMRAETIPENGGVE
jgi:predicted DNA-binding transcriptional regulator AlpA